MYKKAIYLLAVFVFFGVLCTNSYAERISKYLGDVEFVESIIDNPNWIIIDGRGKYYYKKGHIPGAVTYDNYIVNVWKNPHDGRVKSPEELAKLFGEIGISNDKSILIYGKKADFHVLCEMAPVYVGAKDFVYLDGGYEAWVDAGKKIETKINEPQPTKFEVKKLNKDIYVSTNYMMDLVSKYHGNYPDVAIIDVRSDGEYNATKVQSLRGGRVPGAIHIPHDAPLDPETGKFLSKEKLEKIYGKIPKYKKVIFYCHRGCRTAYTFIALSMLGYENIADYEDGWIVYGNRLDTEIENEHWRNMRGVDKKVEYLLEKVRELSQEVNDLK